MCTVFCLGFVSAVALQVQAPQWIARHGLSHSEYQVEFELLEAQGYQIDFVSGYEDLGHAKYAAIWKKPLVSTVRRIARHGLTALQYQNEVNSLGAAGYRVLRVNGYTVSGTDYFAAIWEQSSGVPWVASHGLSFTQYQQHFDQLLSQGYRITHVSGYGAYGATKFAAVWERSPGPAFFSRHGLSKSEIQSQSRTLQSSGYTLKYVSGYPAGPGLTRYVAIWEHGQTDIPVETRIDLSGDSYQQLVHDLRFQGFQPVLVVGHSTEGGARYSTIWQNPNYSQSETHRIDTLVSNQMLTAAVPGLSLAVTQNGRLVFAKSYGQADTVASTPVTSATLFRVASISKTITATGIMKLVEGGFLSLESKVFGANSVLGMTYGVPHDLRVNDITVRSLLNHTSGLWSNQQNIDPLMQSFSLSQADLITTTLQTRPLMFSPGARYQYSNFGYLILGRIIEKVTGVSDEQWIRDNVLVPSGIDSMRIAGSTRGDRIANEATYYDRRFPNLPYDLKVGRMDSSGGWIASAIDLVRFMIRRDGFPEPKDLLSPITSTSMNTPSIQSSNVGTPYAFGIFVSPVGNWWHAGGLPGTSSILVRTSNGFTWSAIANTEVESLDSMMWSIINSGVIWTGSDLFFNGQIAPKPSKPRSVLVSDPLNETYPEEIKLESSDHPFQEQLSELQ